jgi:hypothetical protein
LLQFFWVFCGLLGLFVCFFLFGILLLLFLFLLALRSVLFYRGLYFLCSRVVGHEFVNFDLRRRFTYFVLELVASWLVRRYFDSKYCGLQACSRSNEIQVQHVLLIKNKRSRWSLWQSPERGAILCLGIEGINMEQLLDCMVEIVLESFTGVYDAVVE